VNDDARSATVTIDDANTTTIDVANMATVGVSTAAAVAPEFMQRINFQPDGTDVPAT
jgi:hypothetical protein